MAEARAWFSKSLWEQAAIALAIVSAKPAEHFRTTPGGYFRGMVAKAKTGDLHLNRTIWALRDAADPDRRRKPGRAGEHDPAGMSPRA